jgi:undecaprenyl-diphosphatase
MPEAAALAAKTGGSENAMNAMLATLAGTDFRASARFHSWKPPRWFRLWMRWASRLGDGWVWLAAALVLPTIGDRRPVFSAFMVAGVVSNVAQIVLKRGVRRRRPIEHATRYAFDEFSFPSGHSLNAFALGSVLALAFPPLACPVMFLAASIALSRVALGYHFIGDVLAGTAVGAVIGVGAFWLVVG